MLIVVLFEFALLVVLYGHVIFASRFCFIALRVTLVDVGCFALLVLVFWLTVVQFLILIVGLLFLFLKAFG